MRANLKCEIYEIGADFKLVRFLKMQRVAFRLLLSSEYVRVWPCVRLVGGPVENGVRFNPPFFHRLVGHPTTYSATLWLTILTYFSKIKDSNR